MSRKVLVTSSFFRSIWRKAPQVSSLLFRSCLKMIIRVPPNNDLKNKLISSFSIRVLISIVFTIFNRNSKSTTAAHHYPDQQSWSAQSTIENDKGWASKEKVMPWGSPPNKGISNQQSWLARPLCRDAVMPWINKRSWIKSPCTLFFTCSSFIKFRSIMMSSTFLKS